MFFLYHFILIYKLSFCKIYVCVYMYINSWVFWVYCDTVSVFVCISVTEYRMGIIQIKISFFRSS